MHNKIFEYWLYWISIWRTIWTTFLDFSSGFLVNMTFSRTKQQQVWGYDVYYNSNAIFNWSATFLE